MDWISFSTSSAAALITDTFSRQAAAPRVERHNHNFVQSYDRWFRALYQDKYYYMGDFELMTLAFPSRSRPVLPRVSSRRPFKHGNRILETPALCPPEVVLALPLDWSLQPPARFDRA